MTEELASYGYLIAAICFIMALRGLSSPDTSRGGNRYGIVGMVIAIAVTCLTPGVMDFTLILPGILIGVALMITIKLMANRYKLPEALPRATWAQATKPITALPEATNWCACAMFSPITSRGASAARTPSRSITSSAAAP